MSNNNRNREVAYDEAIQNLVSMFPYIEQTIIETILELNRGALEPTVEQLLTLDPANTSSQASVYTTNNTTRNSGPHRETTSTTTSSSLTTNQTGQPAQNVSPVKPSSRSNSVSPTLMPYNVPSSSSSSPSFSSGVPQGNSSSSSSSSRWRHPLPDNFLMLPDDVLRLAETYGPRSSSSNNLYSSSTDGSVVNPRRTSVTEGNISSSSTSSSGNSGSKRTSVDTDAELAQMLQNELFIEQLRSDPEFAAYLRANPEVAVSLGIPLGSIPVNSNNMRGSSTAPVSSSTNRTGSNTVQSRSTQQQPSATWDISKAVNNVSTDMRRRMELLSARFRRNAATTENSTTKASGTNNSGSTPSKGIFGGIFDSRGMYSSVPQRNEEDERDALIGNGGLDGGGEGVLTGQHHHQGGISSSSSPGTSGNNRADRVKSMNTKSPYLSGTSNQHPPIEIELGGRPSSSGGSHNNPASMVSTKGSLNGGPTMSNNTNSSISNTAAMTFSIEDDEDEDESETKSLTNNKRALHV